MSTMPKVNTLVPVILCGGSGTRLWPLSRAEYPKQFIENNGSSLFLDTVDRAMAVPETQPPLVVCNESQRFLAAAALQSRNLPARILLEHQGRNTAPAIALAALAALASSPDISMDASPRAPSGSPDVQGGDDSNPFLLVLPSDHLIRPLPAFVDAVRQGMETAAQEKLVTFGITPSGPETGYGYIQHGSKLSRGFRVERFVEKPPREKAEAMLAEGGYSWNSGIFLFRARLFLRELEKFRPDIMAAVQKLWQSRKEDMDFIRFHTDLFPACPAESIDYAVMEHTSHAAVIPLEAQWSDLGSWEAVHQAADHDERNNATRGDVMLYDVSGTYVYAGSRLVAALGLRDMVIVETPDAVLVAEKSRTQDVKKVMERLLAEGRSEAQSHLKVYRPWGNYQSLVQGDRFQVKRIEVKPGASLSLQYHHHRAEHWVVVSGTALITRDQEKIVLSEDQSTYIPLGMLHRLENPGRIPLVIIEIQTGSYLGEDDIVRQEDNYGRIDHASGGQGRCP